MNAQKSAVDNPANRKVLGFAASKQGKVADKAIEKLRNSIRELDLKITHAANVLESVLERARRAR